MNLRRLAAVLLPLAVGSASNAFAQNLYSPIILRLPASPRTLALGNTGIVSRDDEVIFFNPAQLTNASGFSASAERYGAHAAGGTMSAVTRFNGGGIGIGMQFADYQTALGAFPATRETMLASGFPGQSLEVVAGIAQSIKGFRTGIAGKFVEEDNASTRFTKPLVDVGVSHDFFRTNFGLAVQNIGAEEDIGTTHIDLPLKTTLGAGRTTSWGPYDFAFTGAVSLLRDDFVQPSGGVEMNYSWLSGYNIALRAGARRPSIGEEVFTAGAGYTVDRVSLDYAAEALPNGRFGHRIGLRVR
ncbi:MAG TPA: hypothetical protein VGM50_02055 [Gemmatimonadaceae bacterium]|jgi:hypothetical protein